VLLLPFCATSLPGPPRPLPRADLVLGGLAEVHLSEPEEELWRPALAKMARRAPPSSAPPPRPPSLHLLLWHSCRHGRRCPRPFLGRARPYLRSESTHCSAWFEIEEGRTMVVSSAPGQRPWRKVAVLDTRLCGPGSGPCD
jgi:hypothetical protein